MIPFVDLKPYVKLVAGADPIARQGMHHTLVDFLDSCEFIGGGPTTQRFEAALAETLDAKHAVACANGTDALQLALRAAGIERGHRVAIPNLTFWATLEAVVNVGATPVLLDIAPTDLQMDFGEFVRAHNSRRFDAAILVHLYGWCSGKLNEFRGFSRDKRITLIEDGAQAFGVKYDGASVFADADIATLSFHPAKVIGAIGDAGAVLTRNERTAKRVRALANHGRSGHYEHAAVGWNSRMDAIQAAWLLRALDVCWQVLDGRRDILHALSQSGSTYAPFGNGYLDLRLVDNPDRVQKRLHELGVDARRVYPRALSGQPGMAGNAILTGPLLVSCRTAERAISLPLWYGMTDEQVNRCSEAFEEAIR
jgi:UDP-2-acetamido-2-deoxy-ribo-hexuluronate aminotransferase